MIVRTIGQGVLLAALACGSAALGQPQRDYTKKCSSAGCHDSFASKTVVHGPVGQEECDACHEPVSGEKHGFSLTEQGADLCFECHDEFSGSVEHQPAAEGQCTTCHDPHSSDAKSLLTSASVVELCAECHDELTEYLRFLHGPVAAGACTMCHNPHASDHPQMLFAKGTAVCLKCHEGMRDRMTQKTYVHSPAKEDCATCHNPHGADNAMMLNALPPDLCIECHDEIEELMEDSKVTHDALTTGKSCAGCHQPHASDVEHVLLMEPMDLCLSCHDKPLASGDGQLLNMAKLLKDNPKHHGPIAQKNCSDCHAPHGGENFRMLAEAFPAAFYSPFDEDNYSLCFSCHEPDLVLEEETDTLTGFRNGKENLHFLHVNRKVKGRTCRACHDVHASKQPKHITESVPFGDWELPVNYRKTATGGSCQPGCHRKYTYDREKSVVNVPKS
jgi:predicted CXXCH cytochrome family protein